MDARYKMAALVALALALFVSLQDLDISRLSLLVVSTVVLAVCIFSLSRARETAEILRAGIITSFQDIEEDVEIDLDRFGRHTRTFVVLVSVITLLYWLGIRHYVHLGLGLVGATLVFFEFVLNFEVLGYLTSNPSAAFSDTGASRVVLIYRTLAVLHTGAVLVAISFLLLR